MMKEKEVPKKRRLRDHAINGLAGIVLIAIVYGTVVFPIENHNDLQDQIRATQRYHQDTLTQNQIIENLLKDHSNDIAIINNLDQQIKDEIGAMNSYELAMAADIRALCAESTAPVNCSNSFTPPPPPSATTP